MPAAAHKPAVQTTTVRLPKRLYEEARSALEKGETNARSLNDLLVEALKEKLKQISRELIDAEFAQMRNDPPYHMESAVVARQFTSNDLDTLRSAEGDEKL